MGADNLAQLRHWERWREIFRLVPIAVFDRPSYAQKALASLPARRFAHHRARPGARRSLADATPPAWAFFHTRLDIRAATRIRAEREGGLPETQRGEQKPVSLFALPSRPRPSAPPIPRPELHDLGQREAP